MKFSIKDFFSKCDQIRSFLKKSLMENFIFLCSENFAKTIRLCKISSPGKYRENFVFYFGALVFPSFKSQSS